MPLYSFRQKSSSGDITWPKEVTWPLAGGIALTLIGVGSTAYGVAKKKPEIILPNLAFMGVGGYLVYKEIKKPAPPAPPAPPVPPAKREFKEVYTKYASPAGEGDWVATGDFRT
ncbi:MAG: hypothetical protein DRI26_02855 [Chloroflexi bacterium]|nr:MAG: hypothetical protein DRI26_02855 [Chloroflexota bacterium]